MHVNSTLPPVGVKILVMHNDKWVLVLRSVWANSKTETIPFIGVESNEVIDIKRGIIWLNYFL